MEFIGERYPTALPDILKFKTCASPFSQFMFAESVIGDESLSPLVWWLSIEKHLQQATVNLVRSVFTAVSSSSGVERVFSTFGFVHSELRN